MHACVVTVSNPTRLNVADTVDYISKSTIHSSFRVEETLETLLWPRLRVLTKVAGILVGLTCCHESTDACVLEAVVGRKGSTWGD